MYKCLDYGKQHITVSDEEAFEYAITQCFKEDLLMDFLAEFAEKMNDGLNIDGFDKFQKEVIEFYFIDGNWIYESDNPEEEFDEEYDNADDSELIDWFNRKRLC